MNFQAEGYDFTGKRVKRRVMVTCWEEAISEYRTNFTVLSRLINQKPGNTAQLIELRTQSITLLESLLDSTFLRKEDESDQQIALHLQAHTSILLQHNQTVKALLNRLSNFDSQQS